MELDFWFDPEAANIAKCDKHGEYIENGFGCPVCEYEDEMNSEPYEEENEEV